MNTFVNEMLAKYRIVQLQNHPANINADHVSICGFFTTEEQFAEHADKLLDNFIAYHTV